MTNLKKKLLATVFTVFLLDGCSLGDISDSFLETKYNKKYPKDVPSKCYTYEGKGELNKRKALFPELSESEISRRNKIILEPYPKNDFSSNKENAFNKIIEAFNNASPGQRFIPVDLREYKEVHLDNLAITNLDPKDANERFLKRFTVYKQKTFFVININSEGAQIFIGDEVAGIDKKSITPLKNRIDLTNSEIVINTSHSKAIPNYYPTVSGNIKLSGNKNISKQFSILASHINLEKLASDKGGIRLDIREFREHFLGLPTQATWNLKVYDVSESYIHNGKDTTGEVNYLINKDILGKDLQRFKVEVDCYYDPTNKFKGSLD